MSHRRLFLAALAAAVCLLAPGCGNTVQEKILGTWTLDLEATKELPHFKAMTEEERAALYKNLDGMTLEVTFTETTMSRTSRVQMAEGLDQMQDSVSGTYKVNRAKGNSLVLAVTTGEGMKRVSVETWGDRIILDMDESKTALRRK